MQFSHVPTTTPKVGFYDMLALGMPVGVQLPNLASIDEAENTTIACGQQGLKLPRTRVSCERALGCRLFSKNRWVVVLWEHRSTGVSGVDQHCLWSAYAHRFPAKALGTHSY